MPAVAIQEPMAVAASPAAKDPVLRIRLHAGYGKVTVLDGVDLDLHPGECLGLVGTSGAGKSTLVLSLLGLLKWRGGWVRGEVTLNGKNLLTLSEREARKIRGREIALVPQSPLSALNPALSLRAQFREGWRAHQPSLEGFKSRVAELIRQVQLPEGASFLDRKPGQISVGQAQRVVLAMALLHRPAVLVADEPISALDPATQREVLDLLRLVRRQQQTALLYVSHDLISVLELCESIAVLQAGRIAGQRNVGELGSADLPPALQSLMVTLPVPVTVLLENMSYHPKTSQ